MHSRRRPSLRLGRFGAITALVVVLGGLVAQTVSANAASANKTKSCVAGNNIKIKNSQVCAGLAYFKGKTFTFISGSAGGGTDLSARALAPLIQSYLHAAAVNVSDQGQAHGIPGQDALAAAAPTGLEFGYINTSSILQDDLTNTPGFNFNPRRLGWIVGQIGTPSILIASPSSGLTTAAALKAAATPTKILAEIPSQGSSGLEVLFGMLHIKYQLVTSYSSTSAIVQGFQRGDGPTATMPYANAEGFLQANQAKAVVITDTPPAHTALRGLVVNTPTFADLLKQYLPKHPSKTQLTEKKFLLDFIAIGQPIVTQSRVSAAKLAALRAAFQWAYKQNSYIQGALAAGVIPNYVNPVAAKNIFNYMLAHGSSLACYFASTCS